MAGSTHELAILVTAKGALQAARNLGQVDSKIKGIGRTAGAGLRNAGANLAKFGLIAGGVLAAGVEQGISSLATLESAVSSVDGAIKQMGLTGKVTGAQIATWSNEIEASVGAAFDDKDITQATATLIRFGHLAPASIRPAMVVMTDLAAKTGSVESAATILAKALADPAKAAGKLTRMGLVLTKQQQDQIKAMVKAGKTGKAQALLLDILAKTTKGAAAASQGPYKRAMSVLRDVTEDAERALAEGFLPVLEKVAGLLSSELAKPQTIQSIREFGKGLASGLDKLIEMARGLPWDSIGNAMKLTGQGAKAALDMFNGLPDWVKTAVLTGWGLNKLTGGALGSIVGQLGSGLIKGVLGMNAGVVNINAGVVRGGGLPVGGGPGGGGGGGLGSFLAGFLGTAGILAAGAGGVLSIQDIQSGTEAGVRKGMTALASGPGGLIGRSITDLIGDPLGDLVKAITGQNKPTVAAPTRASAGRDEGVMTQRAVNALRVTLAAKQQTQIARAERANSILDRIALKPTSRVSVSVRTTVSVRDSSRAASRSSMYSKVQMLERAGIY